MTKKVAEPLSKSGCSKTGEGSGAHFTEASSATERPGADESEDSASLTESAEIQVSGSELSNGDGPSQGIPSTSDGAQDGEAASDNASQSSAVSSDEATPIANESIAELDWTQPVISTSTPSRYKSSPLKNETLITGISSQDYEQNFDDADSALGEDRYLQQPHISSDCGPD